MTKEELEKEATEYAQKLGAKDFIAKPKEIVAYFGYLAGAEPREKRIAELIALINAERERQEKCDDVHLRTIAELEKENAELKSENQKWKDEWQEQVQKATDEGYARTLQTIQLTKAKELLERFLGLGNLWDLDCKDYFPLRKEAEQFLSEVEK